MSECKSKFRERVYQRPVFQKRHIEVLGDTLPPDDSFLFEDIVITDNHKIEDLTITVVRKSEPYNGQDKRDSRA